MLNIEGAYPASTSYCINHLEKIDRLEFFLILHIPQTPHRIIIFPCSRCILEPVN